MNDHDDNNKSFFSGVSAFSWRSLVIEHQSSCKYLLWKGFWNGNMCHVFVLKGFTNSYFKLQLIAITDTIFDQTVGYNLPCPKSFLKKQYAFLVSLANIISYSTYSGLFWAIVINFIVKLKLRRIISRRIKKYFTFITEVIRKNGLQF